MVSLLRPGLNRAYSTVHMPCQVTSTRIYGAAAMSLRRKGGASWDDEESEPADGCPIEAWQFYPKATCPRGSGSGRT